MILTARVCINIYVFYAPGYEHAQSRIKPLRSICCFVDTSAKVIFKESDVTFAHILTETEICNCFIIWFFYFSLSENLIHCTRDCAFPGAVNVYVYTNACSQFHNLWTNNWAIFTNFKAVFYNSPLLFFTNVYKYKFMHFYWKFANNFIFCAMRIAKHTGLFSEISKQNSQISKKASSQKSWIKHWY